MAFAFTTKDRRAFVYVEADAVVIELYAGHQEGKLRVRTVDEYNEALRAHRVERVLGSSSIDFPEEFTSDPDVLALARRIADRSY